MARIRNIKPGFFMNECLAELHPLTRILFAGLWCHADRAGRLEDRPKKIKAEVLPYDDHDVDRALDELQSAGFLARYQNCKASYIQILTFEKHQNAHVKEPPSTIPAPVEHSASTVPAPDEHISSTASAQPPQDLEPSEEPRNKNCALLRNYIKSDSSLNSSLDELESDGNPLKVDEPSSSTVPAQFQHSSGPAVTDHLSLITDHGSRITDHGSPNGKDVKAHRAKNARQADTQDPAFAGGWETRPRRSGTDSKQAAYRAWCARLKEGVEAEAMLAGLSRYRAWCEARGKCGTEYVMQASTFLGPDRHFDEPWPVENGKTKQQPWKTGVYE